MTTTGRVRQRKSNQMAPYFVQMREFERRLLRGAIEEADGSTGTAAAMLGVGRHYLVSRAKLLGGVLGDDPKHEPPGPALAAFNASSAARERAPRSNQPDDSDEPDA